MHCFENNCKISHGAEKDIQLVDKVKEERLLTDWLSLESKLRDQLFLLEEGEKL